MNVPANLKYSNDHEWCRVEGDTAVIGITDFAQSQLGDIVFVDVPTVGETLAAGEVFGSIEAVKTVSDAFLPIGGEILEFNDAVDADPAIVNKDAYGEDARCRPVAARPRAGVYGHAARRRRPLGCGARPLCALHATGDLRDTAANTRCARRRLRAEDRTG